MCEIVYNILITNFTVHRCIIRSNAPSNLQMQPLGCIFVYALNCITFGTAIDETVAWMIRCAFRHSVKVYQKQSLYLPSDTEGCAEGFIFCPQTANLPAETASKGVNPINFAYAHNEKSCPETIDRILRYEGVQGWPREKEVNRYQCISINIKRGLEISLDMCYT